MPLFVACMEQLGDHLVAQHALVQQLQEQAQQAGWEAATRHRECETLKSDLRERTVEVHERTAQVQSLEANLNNLRGVLRTAGGKGGKGTGAGADSARGGESSGREGTSREVDPHGSATTRKILKKGHARKKVWARRTPRTRAPRGGVPPLLMQAVREAVGTVANPGDAAPFAAPVGRRTAGFPRDEIARSLVR